MKPMTLYLDREYQFAIGGHIVPNAGSGYTTGVSFIGVYGS